ncbi:hypothetical protein QR680_008974 [Steinernema hermaphroditum]|uniref:Uncharacterized protein n=1 Tax=Steinernema hermaphroditum TaxID=289476 RepID=A0AA39M927_9BILA|nr:hypothetical protein QR680_008974 [Steinernema hermaphroditum]
MKATSSESNSTADIEKSMRLPRETEEKTPLEGTAPPDDPEKLRTVTRTKSESLEETIFEEVLAPKRPAAVTMPTRWITKYKKDIENLRRRYKKDRSKSGKMSLNDLSFMSHFGIEEPSKKELSTQSSSTQPSMKSVREVVSDKSIESRSELPAESERDICIDVEPGMSPGEKMSPVSPSAPYFTALTSQPSSELSEVSTRSESKHRMGEEKLRPVHSTAKSQLAANANPQRHRHHRHHRHHRSHDPSPNPSSTPPVPSEAHQQKTHRQGSTHQRDDRHHHKHHHHHGHQKMASRRKHRDVEVKKQ